MANIKIKFNQDYEVKDEAGEKFKKGKSYSLNESSAAHFISRGVAEIVKSKAKEKKEPEPKKAEKGLLEKAKDALTGKADDK